MGSQFDASELTPFKVLILGGCYGGLSAALNLIDLSEGRAARQGNGVVPGHDGKIPIDITIVDERDGYCMFECPHHIYVTTLRLGTPKASPVSTMYQLLHNFVNPRTESLEIR